MMKVNDFIRFRRNQIGKTLDEVAKEVGVSEATVSRWESGEISNMRRDKIHLLAKSLSISPIDLLDLDNVDLQQMSIFNSWKATAAISNNNLDLSKLPEGVLELVLFACSLSDAEAKAVHQIARAALQIQTIPAADRSSEESSE